MAHSRSTPSKKIRMLVFLALFSAIIIIMAFMPVGFLKIGPVEITFITIPVAVGAIMFGPIAGTVLGTVFGIVSFIQCFIGSPLGMVLLPLNPFFTFIVCVIPRVLCGFLTGLIAKLINRKTDGNTVSCVVSSLVCPVFNTIFFVSALVLLFGNYKAVLEMYGAENMLAFGIVFVSLIFFNAVIEAIACFVIGCALSKVITHFLPEGELRRKQ